MKTILRLSLLACIGILVGCSSTLKPIVLDPTTKHFPTQTAIALDAAIVKKPFDKKFKKLAYLKTDAKGSTQYHKFFKESLQNMYVFDVVADKEYFETLIIQKNLSGKISNVSDLVGLHNLAQEIGPFLIIEPDVTFKGGYNYEADLKAIDPSTGEVILQLHHAAFNWSGLDEPLFYPLLNCFLDWTNEQASQTPPPAPATTPSAAPATPTH